MDARVGTSGNLPALTVTGKRRESGMSTFDLGGGKVVALDWQMTDAAFAEIQTIRAELFEAEQELAHVEVEPESADEPLSEEGDATDEPEADRP